MLVIKTLPHLPVASFRLTTPDKDMGGEISTDFAAHSVTTAEELVDSMLELIKQLYIAGVMQEKANASFTLQ